MKEISNNYPGRSSAAAFYLLFTGMFALLLGLGANLTGYLQSMFLSREDFEAAVLLCGGVIVGWQLAIAGCKNAWGLSFDLLIFVCCLIFYNHGLQTETGGKVLMGFGGLLYAVTRLINLDQIHWFDQITQQFGGLCTTFRDNYRRKQFPKGPGL